METTPDLPVPSEKVSPRRFAARIARPHPGHVSLFRDADGVLLAGDALATLDQDSAVAMVFQRR